MSNPAFPGNTAPTAPPSYGAVPNAPAYPGAPPAYAPAPQYGPPPSAPIYAPQYGPPQPGYYQNAPSQKEYEAGANPGFPGAGAPQASASGYAPLRSQPIAGVVIYGANGSPWGEVPQPFTCPFCGYNGLTSVNEEIGNMAMVLAGGLCLIGCWPCCLIPFCATPCKDMHHICPSCHNTVGVLQRMQC